MNKIIFDKITTYFKKHDFKFLSNKDYIRLNIEIGGAIGILSLSIHIYDDSYSTYATINSRATDDNIAKISEYLHRANFGLLEGNFELDYDDGMIRYNMITMCPNGNNLSDRDIQKSVILPCRMFELYGGGLMKLMVGVGSPKELIEDCERRMR